MVRNVSGNVCDMMGYDFKSAGKDIEDSRKLC